MEMPLEASLLQFLACSCTAHFTHDIKWRACLKARDMHGLRPNSDFYQVWTTKRYIIHAV